MESNITENGLYLIIGANGSGKTTLMENIFKDYPNNITLMRQEDNQILKNESVLTNISMNVVSPKKVIEFLEHYNLEYILSKKSKYLSGGEKRIVCLLRALLSKKDFIILDEPSNDLDIDTFKIAKNMITDISNEKKILIVSHDDRFSEYIEKFEVIDGKIDGSKIKKITPFFNIKNEEEQSINLKIKHNYLIIIFYFIALLVTSFTLYKMLDPKAQEPLINSADGIYQLSALYSSSLSDYDNVEAINTSLISAATKINKSKYFEEQATLNKHSDIDKSILLKKNSYKNLFILEFYDEKNHSFIDINQEISAYYKAVLNLEDSIDIKINDESYFKDSNIIYIHPDFNEKENIEPLIQSLDYQINIDPSLLENEIKIDFNKNLYTEIIKKYQTEELYVSEIIVQLLDGHSFFDFIYSNNLHTQNFMIKGYEPEIFNMEINKYSSTVYALQKNFLFISLLILVLLLIIYIEEDTYKNSYSVLFHYGYDTKKILDYRKKVYQLPILKKIITGVLLVDLAILWFLLKSSFILIVLIIVCIFFIIAYLILPLIIKYEIRKGIL